MKYYKNIDTGVVWSEEEIREAYNQQENPFEPYDEYLEDMLKQGRERIGGLVEIDTANSYWYAVMQDNNDNDWGTGSYSLEEAKDMLEWYGWTEGYIAVIDNSTGNPVCVEEIR